LWQSSWKQPQVVTHANSRNRVRTGSKLRAITRVAERAGVDHWTPNQLRHTRATEVRKLFGLEAAQVVLGHAGAFITQVYAERNATKAKEVALKTG